MSGPDGPGTGVRIAQLSDTHVVARGATYFGCDTARYLADAVEALHALASRPDFVVVSGDLVNSGTTREYEHFAAIMQRLHVPYVVIPGNHDRRDAMRSVLPAATYGHSDAGPVLYALEEYGVRFVGLDANAARPWPGARLSAASLDWLETTLDARPATPTVIGIHQPPYRTGLHYLDVFGVAGARRLRLLAHRHAQVGRVIAGHVHCVTTRRWQHALALSAPSTAPQIVPLLCMDGTLLGARREAPGFAMHAWSPAGGFETTIYRRDGSGVYRPCRVM